MVYFTFKNQTISFQNKTYIVSGSGRASVSVDGTYTYYPGDYWNPPEDDVDIDEVTLDDIDEIDIDEIDIEGSDEEITDEIFDSLVENDDFIDAVCDQLNLDIDDYDYDDVVEALIDQQRDAYDDYYDDRDDDDRY